MIRDNSSITYGVGGGPCMDQHKLVLQRCMVQCYLRYEVVGTSNFLQDKGPFKCYVTFCFWKLDINQLHRSANNVAP